MKAEIKNRDQLPPRGKMLKVAATGKEREDALQNMRELSRLAGERAKKLGLTDGDIQKLIDGP